MGSWEESMAPLVKPAFVVIWLLVCLGMAISVEARLAQKSASAHETAVRSG